ncbi:hypothetical protein MMC09_000198 [Bachmanniomyces sp. S44760]|nr:hypothetical protein [Bachmanniomyces sp. S44760]
MSELFPRVDYAEDQKYARTILVTHSLHRGFVTGAIFGGVSGSVLSLRNIIRKTPANFLPHLVRGSAVGSVCGLGVLAVGTQARMWGRDEYAWQDRAYRLLRNRG